MKFALKVIQGSQVSTLMLEAHDAQAAQQQAVARGYGVLTVQASDSVVRSRRRWFGGARSRFNVAQFSQELQTLLAAGLSLIEAIEGLTEKEQQPEALDVLVRLRAALYEGLPLSQAMARQAETFTPLYIALIQASERTGDLAAALARHVNYHGQIEAIRKKIIAASIYPLILLVVGSLVVAFLLGYVVPRFSSVYERGGESLPWASRLLLQWGQFVQQHGDALWLAMLLTVLVLGLALMQTWVRRGLLVLFLRLPGIGEAARIYQLARFYRTLGMLCQGGIPLLRALEMVRSLLPVNLQAALSQVMVAVSEGKVFSASMTQYGLTTPIASRMLRVGERSGALDEMLERVGMLYDDDTARRVEWLSKLLEPSLMVLIGLIVGLVVVLMYMPIFELAGAIQ